MMMSSMMQHGRPAAVSEAILKANLFTEETAGAIPTVGSS